MIYLKFSQVKLGITLNLDSKTRKFTELKIK